MKDHKIQNQLAAVSNLDSVRIQTDFQSADKESVLNKIVIFPSMIADDIYLRLSSLKNANYEMFASSFARRKYRKRSCQLLGINARFEIKASALNPLHLEAQDSKVNRSPLKKKKISRDEKCKQLQEAVDNIQLQRGKLQNDISEFVAINRIPQNARVTAY